jgi:hypothetical protein
MTIESSNFATHIVCPSHGRLRWRPLILRNTQRSGLPRVVSFRYRIAGRSAVIVAHVRLVDAIRIAPSTPSHFGGRAVTFF